MTDLVKQKCVPCEEGGEPLKSEQIVVYSAQVPEWSIASDNKSITRELTFKSFVDAVVFITDVAHIAEEEGHHPDLNLHGYNKVLITLSTHALGGLSENDFILAAKVDELLKGASDD